MATPSVDLVDLADNVWELYDTSVDWSQSRDLAAEHPELLERLKRPSSSPRPPGTTSFPLTTARSAASLPAGRGCGTRWKAGAPSRCIRTLKGSSIAALRTMT